jgi:ABC-2 type transport system permease protein
VSDLMNNENDKKNNFIGNIKASFSGRKFRSGAYVTMMSAIVIVIVLVVNLIVTKMDYQIDISTQNYYTLSDKTKEVVKGLKDKVTIYYMVQSGNEEGKIQKIAESIDSLSNNITIVEKDPVLYPKFASQYVEDKTVTENSFIVVNETNGRSRYIDFSEMLIQELNYQTYQMESTGIDVEGKLISAVNYVSYEKLPVMYVTEGHGETKMGDALKASLDKMNVNVQALATLTKESIPEDCDILFINAPVIDFSEEESKMIKDYMAAGGNAIVTLNYKAEGLSNFNSIIDYYGMKSVNGIVVEGDANRHYQGYPHYLIPEINNHDITQLVRDKGLYVIVPIASGLQISDTTRSSLKVEPLLTTSDSAYSKVNVKSTTLEKENDDIAGPFHIGLIATDKYNNVTSKMVVYSSDTIFSDSVLQSSGNVDILSGTVGFLTGKASALSIPSKSLASERVTLTAQQAIIWGALTVLIIPVIILAIGIVVTLKRRKR